MGEESGMRGRAAGLSVMEQVVRLQDAAPPRSALARALGVNPLTEEAEPWFAGATGEREVGAVLSRLPEGWTAFHAVPIGRDESDIDHLVVGPGGVFSINTKHHRGKKVWVGAKAVLVDGMREPYIRNSEFEASRIRRLLAEQGLTAPVHGMVAVVGAAKFTVAQQPARVTIVQSSELLRSIRRRPNVVDVMTTTAIVHLFDHPATWRSDTPVGDTVGRFEAIARDVRTAAFVRRGWALAGALALIAGAVALLPH
ncbi:nuclease-related domain-containing protein [Leifsonia poae]|uniref:nuclease-related domain-containing protein n=1 Tax=Leifsonia poae TaxID=110933 RepID=UPI003D67CC74